MQTKLACPKHVSTSVFVEKTQHVLTSTLFDPRPVEKRGLDINGLNEISEKSKKMDQDLHNQRIYYHQDH